MKIGIYSFEYPSYIYIGGAGDYIKQLAEHLAVLGHDVNVFVASFEAAPPVVAHGVTVHTVSIRNIPYTKSLQFRMRVKRAILQASKVVGGFDILHSNIQAVVRVSHVPSVLTVHHVVASLQDDLSQRSMSGELNPMVRFMEKRAVMRADKIVTVSARTKDDLVSFYEVPDQNVFPILNGVPFALYQIPDIEIPRIRAQYTSANDELLFVTAPARLDDQRKGLKYLFEALRQISPLIKFRCVILGRGDIECYREYLDDERLRGRLEFPGFVDVDVKRKLMAAADLFVLPSTLEGCCISLLEAMAAGRPVVATRVGGIPELIRSAKNGILVPAKDPRKLADAIINLAADKQRSTEIGNYNRAFAKEELSWTSVAERTLEVYETAIGARSAKAK